MPLVPSWSHPDSSGLAFLPLMALWPSPKRHMQPLYDSMPACRFLNCPQQETCLHAALGNSDCQNSNRQNCFCKALKTNLLQSTQTRDVYWHWCPLVSCTTTKFLVLFVSALPLYLSVTFLHPDRLTWTTRASVILNFVNLPYCLYQLLPVPSPSCLPSICLTYALILTTCHREKKPNHPH